MFDRLSPADQEDCRAIFAKHNLQELDYVLFLGRSQGVQLYGEFTPAELTAILEVASYLSLATHLENQLKLGIVERKFELRG